MQKNLTILAGREALRILRDEGFDRESFSCLVGASGGPKWLVLSRMDRVLCDHLIAARTSPLHMLGSSIGSFRHACLAQKDPRAAIDRFEEAYIGQCYETQPTALEVTRESRRILDVMLGETGIEEILADGTLKTHIVTARSRLGVTTDNRVGLSLGLAAAATANAVHRQALGLFFQRVVFSTAGPVLGFSDFATRTVSLTRPNLAPALLASGSIPLVMEGVRDVPDAPAGILRDGGVIDYHFDFRFDPPEGLVLYPHFFDRITPGWLDKQLKWRKPSPQGLAKVVLVAPSREFVAELPGGKVPDRNDFRTLSTKDRLTRWHAVVDACRHLADELDDLLATGRIAEHAEPLGT